MTDREESTTGLCSTPPSHCRQVLWAGLSLLNITVEELVCMTLRPQFLKITLQSIMNVKIVEFISLEKVYISLGATCLIITGG